MLKKTKDLQKNNKVYQFELVTVQTMAQQNT